MSGLHEASINSARSCSPRCPVPAAEHLDPKAAWRGTVMSFHGPRSGGDASFCLCGHPGLETCPMWLETGSRLAEVPHEELLWMC